jgi:hypothetical protein
MLENRRDGTLVIDNNSHLHNINATMRLRRERNQMTKETGASSIFTKERIADAVQLWTRSSISLIDVRHQLIRPDKPLQNYIMPTSMLIYPAAGWPMSKWSAPSTDGALWSFSRGQRDGIIDSSCRYAIGYLHDAI